MLSDPYELERFKNSHTSLTRAQFEELYSEEQQLGSGSFGQVVKAKTIQGKEVAIKFFNKEATRHFKQIIHEVDNLKQLQHPNIARFYDCYIIDGSFYCIVIEYCAGGNLTEYIKIGVWTDLDKIKLCQQIASALAYAHKKKIVHRDLKPDNILIGKDGVAKICDFGCSTKMQDGSGAVLASQVGSLAYMDKRITDGNPYDLSVDIYAMGMIFLSIFKGKGLYDECQSKKAMLELRSEIELNFQDFMNTYLTGVPSIMSRLIKSCLNTDYKSRYSAAAISSMLEKQLQNYKSFQSAKMLSTMDQEEIEDNSSRFAMGLMSFYNKCNTLERNLSTRRALIELLKTFRQNMEKLPLIGPLKYVEPHTKEQFCVVLIFYYNFWLDRLLQFIKQQNSSFSDKYPRIKPEAIEEDMMRRTEKNIEEERSKYADYFTANCKKVYNKLRFRSNKFYVPDSLRKVVSKVAMGLSLQFDLFSDSELLQEMRTFFERRIESEFKQNAGLHPDSESMQKLEEVRSIMEVFDQ